MVVRVAMPFCPARSVAEALIATVTALVLPIPASAALDTLTFTVAVLSRAMWKQLEPSTITPCPAVFTVIATVPSQYV
jgi:hypothetical protein